MANALNRNLKTGEKLVMINGETATVGATYTFGKVAFTSGSALLVIPEGHSEEVRCSGWDIDAETMERFAKVNGWDKKQEAHRERHDHSGAQVTQDHGHAAWAMAADMWKDKPESEEMKKHWNFRLCVVVDSFLGPMSPRYQFILDMGAPLIGAVYSKQPLPDGDLMFIFPDRWITPRFAISFNHALNEHPSIVKGPRRTVLIVCFQPYIVGDCMREQVLIIRDDEQKDGKDIIPDMRNLWGIPEERW